MPADATVGQMQSIPMGGGGSLWSVVSAPVLVSYEPPHGADDGGASISLLLQFDGAMTISQNHRVCRLEAGGMCLVDERFGFHLQGEVCSHIVFLRMPRRAVLGRHPYLEHCTARMLDADDPGAQLLRDTLTRAVRTAPDLREEQRGSVLAAMIHLLGAATAPSVAESDEATVAGAGGPCLHRDARLGDADLAAANRWPRPRASAAAGWTRCCAGRWAARSPPRSGAAGWSRRPPTSPTPATRAARSPRSPSPTASRTLPISRGRSRAGSAGLRAIGALVRRRIEHLLHLQIKDG